MMRKRKYPLGKVLNWMEAEQLEQDRRIAEAAKQTGESVSLAENRHTHKTP
jgi:hypothetical protein